MAEPVADPDRSVPIPLHEVSPGMGAPGGTSRHAGDEEGLGLGAAVPTVVRAAPDGRRGRRAARFEGRWRVWHRVRSGVALSLATVALGLLLAAAVSLAISAAVVALNHATATSTNAP
jgi:hypothetical protein